MQDMNELLRKLLEESEEATEFPDGPPFKPNALIQYPDTLQIAYPRLESDDPLSLVSENRKKPYWKR